MLHSLPHILAATYTTTTTTTDLTATQATALAGMMLIIALSTTVFTIFIVIAMWKVFTKAGQAGWKVLIPIYSQYVLLQIVGRPGWWLLLYFVPIANLIVTVIVMLDLAKSFGKDVLFGVMGLILFSPIGLAILGFGKATYQGPQPHSLDSVTPPAVTPPPATPPPPPVQPAA